MGAKAGPVVAAAAPGRHQAPTVRQQTVILFKLAFSSPLYWLLSVNSLVSTTLSRAAGFCGRHPMGWSIREELIITMMRGVLSGGDYLSWRAFLREIGEPRHAPQDLDVRPVWRRGSSSLWFRLNPEARPLRPRAVFNMVFIHGGAFVSGTASQYQLVFAMWLRELAARGIICSILSIDYPLAPEHPYPAARNACRDELQWLMEAEPDVPLIVVGDSAGGNLALSSVAHLRDSGRLWNPPVSMLLISPYLDQSNTARCRLAPHEVDGHPRRWDYLMTPDELLARMAPLYAKDSADRESPYVSPAKLASFDGLVRKEIMVVSGGAEMLLPDIRAFVRKLHTASAAASRRGSPGAAAACTYLEAPGKVHCWPMLPLPEVIPKHKPIYEFFQRSLGL